MNTVFQNGRSGNIDIWSGSNLPSGTSHVQGIQVRHSTGNHYGFQLVNQYNQDKIWHRRITNNSFAGWQQVWTANSDGSGSGLDADTCDGQHLGTSASVQFGSVLSTGNVTAYSDRRIKENITPITEALSKVQRLTGNTYTRNDQEDTATKYAGLIAQEVEDVLPEAVREVDDGIKALDYNATIALLVESIKELKTEVDDLKSQLENK
jgi:tetrahydromethanopterin S-methyltransferase subunit B